MGHALISRYSELRWERGLGGALNAGGDLPCNAPAQGVTGRLDEASHTVKCAGREFEREQARIGAAREDQRAAHRGKAEAAVICGVANEQDRAMVKLARLTDRAPHQRCADAAPLRRRIDRKWAEQ